MQFDNMVEEVLINKELLTGILPLFHIPVHFQVKTSTDMFKEVICMNSLLVCSNKQHRVSICLFVHVFSYSISLSFLSFQLL